MKSSKPSPAALAMLLIIGVAGLFRFCQNMYQFSQNVSTVDVVGLYGGGAACGAATFGFIYSLMSKTKA